VSGGDAPANPPAAVAKSVGDRDHAGADLVGDLERQLNRAHAGNDPDAIAIREAPGAGVLGMQDRRAAVGTLHQPPAVVHPRVVATQLPPADQHQVVPVGEPGIALDGEPVESLALLEQNGRREP